MNKCNTNCSELWRHTFRLSDAQAINDSKEILIGPHVEYSEQKSVDLFYREHIFVLQAICGNVYFCLSDRKDLGDFSLHMFDETVVPDFIASWSWDKGNNFNGN